jgi:hypothetical protein
VLAMAASQGYEPCGYTLGRLDDFRER